MDFIIHIFWWMYLMMFLTAIFCEIARVRVLLRFKVTLFCSCNQVQTIIFCSEGGNFDSPWKMYVTGCFFSHLEHYQYPIQHLDFISDHQWWSPFSPVRCSRYPMFSCCDDIFHWFNFGWVDDILFIYVCMFFHIFHIWYSISWNPNKNHMIPHVIHISHMIYFIYSIWFPNLLESQ